MPRNEAGARRARSIYGATLNAGNDDDDEMSGGVKTRKCKGDVEESKSKLPFALLGSSGIMAF